MKREPIIIDRKPNSDITNPHGYIYITTNLVNNKKYLGKHSKQKLDKHYLGSGIAIMEAVQKYGRNNFISEPIEWCDSPEKLDERELWWTQFLEVVKSDQYYNEIEGGTGYQGGELHPRYKKGYLWTGEKSPMYGHFHSEETKRKMAQSHFGRPHPFSEDGLEKMRTLKPMLGKHHSEKTKMILSETHQGERNANYGNHSKLTETHKDKIKMSMQKYKGSANHNSSEVVQLTKDLAFVRKFSYLGECIEYGFNPSCVSDCCNGRQKSSRGYIFMYYKDYEKKESNKNELYKDK